MSMLFEVRQIVRRYGRRTALDGVSFDVAPGEVVGVLGANGAGKTTLMRVLAAYLQPESGDVVFDGRSVFADKVGYYGVLGYLPERCPLYDEMRVGDYLAFRGRLRGLGWRRTARRVKDVTAACGLNEVIRRPVGALSAGFRRRVGLADAILAQPKVLLLDDPFAGLDVAHGQALRQTVASMSVRSAVILTGHDVAGMAEICTRFLVLREGRLVTARRATGCDTGELVRALSRAVAGLDTDEVSVAAQGGGG
jgi:ABC-2 type transport system ATP-binding protein